MKRQRNTKRSPHYFGYFDEEGRPHVFRTDQVSLLYELGPHPASAERAVCFGWGETTSSAGMLGLAILSDYLGDDARAVRLNPEFTRSVIMRLHGRYWRLTLAEIEAALARQSA